MYFCTDCHLPTPLDDVVSVFADGSCTCLTCNHRAASGRSLPAALRQAILAALDGLEPAQRERGAE